MSTPAVRRSRRRVAAMTMIELTIVVVVIGLVASVGAGVYSRTIARNRCESAARRVVLDLNWARRRAEQISADQSVVFDATTDAYTLPSIQDIDASADDYTVDLAEPPYEVDLVSGDFEGNLVVVFGPFGMPDSSGGVVLRVGDHYRTVVLDGETGVARVIDAQAIPVEFVKAP